MKHTLLALATLFILTGCEKNEPEPAQGISIRVKLIDHLCSDFIFQIQDAEYIPLGEANFNYKGKVYDGVFSSTILCGGINNQPLLTLDPKDSIYSVKIFKEQPGLTTNCPTCLAVLDKKPALFYYVMPD